MTAGCPACTSYPPRVQARIDAAGQDHADALAALRSGEAVPGGRDRILGATITTPGALASWWADGPPWDQQVSA